MPRRAASTASDRELLSGCSRGEQVAWDALVDRYAGLIYSIPRKYGFADADAADVFQSVCLTLIEKLGSVREPDRLAAWLATTTSRECLAVIRRRRREPGLPSTRDRKPPSSEPVDPQPLPEDELLAVERQQIVRTAVSQLPASCARLVEALFSESPRPSYRQVAGGLRVPPNSLGPTRARCLQKLRRLLTAAGYF